MLSHADVETCLCVNSFKDAVVLLWQCTLSMLRCSHVENGAASLLVSMVQLVLLFQWCGCLERNSLSALVNVCDPLLDGVRLFLNSNHI